MKQAQTTEEIISRLNGLNEDDTPNMDREDLHMEADQLLLDALILAGHSPVVEAFQAARDRIGFWYA